MNASLENVPPQEPCIISDVDEVADCCEVHTHFLQNLDLKNNEKPKPPSEHNYFSQRLKKTKRPTKSLMTNVSIENETEASHYIPLTNISDVANCCEIQTSEAPCDLSLWRNFVNSPLHNNNYEVSIRERPTYHCHSCHRFLFQNQCFTTRCNERMQQLGLSDNAVLCFTCRNWLSKDKMPESFHGNSMGLSPVPDVLKTLTFSERKLICKLQIFLTLGVLPGGQFCERGSVLHLPVDVSNVLSQLPLEPSKSDQISVCYQNGQTKVMGKNKVSPFNILKALQWLKANNELYSDLDLESAGSKLNKLDNGSHDIDFEETFENTRHEIMVPADNAGFESTSQSSSTEMFTLNILRSIHSPVNIYEFEHGEELAFPWLFPEGKNGYNPTRKSLSMYLRNRVYNIDTRFRTDMMYLLQSAVAFDKYLKLLQCT